MITIKTINKHENHHSNSRMETNKGVNQTGKITNNIYFDGFWKVTTSVFIGVIVLALIIFSYLGSEEGATPPDSKNSPKQENPATQPPANPEPQKPTFQPKELFFEPGPVIGKTQLAYKNGPGVWIYTKESHPSVLDEYVDWDKKDVILIQAPRKDVSLYSAVLLGSITQTAENTVEFGVDYKETGVHGEEAEELFPKKFEKSVEKQEYLEEYYNIGEYYGRFLAIVDKGAITNEQIKIIKNTENEVLYDSSEIDSAAPSPYKP